MTQPPAPPAPPDGPPRAVTRNDVARVAGVSNAVVSYVMNNGPKKVSAATEQRVRDVIEQLGYQPNLTARALSSGSTRSLGLQVTDLLNPFFAEFAYAVEAAASRRDHTLLIANSNSDPASERRRVLELEARQVDGLLLASVLNPVELAEWAAARRRRSAPSTVVMNTTGPIAGLVTIGPDFTAGARAVVEHLIGHGHRRVTLVTGDQPTAGVPVEPRELGWRQALAEAGLRPGPIARGSYDRQSGYDMGKRLLDGRRPPTAIFAVSDLLGVGILRAAHERGVRVPDDLAVVCFDGSRETEYSWPPLTTVRQPLEAMASDAITLVLDPESANAEAHHVFEVPLIIRESCGCPGPSAVRGQDEVASSVGSASVRTKGSPPRSSYQR